MGKSLLAPCVCGSKKRRLIFGLNAVNQNIYYVRCPDCGTATVPARLKDSAIHKWNMMYENERGAKEP